MTGNPLADRLREGGLVLGRDRIEELGGALERLGAARMGIEDALTRVRLAHLLPADEEGLDRFLSVVNKDGELIASSDRQMLAVLAATAMIEDFGRDTSRRSAAVMRRVMIGALATRTLARSEHLAAHPDLCSWADYLLVTYGRQVRATRGLAQPPTLSEPSAAPEGEELTREQKIDDALDRHEDYARETGDWLEQSSGAGQIAALHEENQILWWLVGRLPSGDGSKEAIRAARELAALSLTPPPPASAELFKRRLVLVGPEWIDVEEFERHRTGEPVLVSAAGVATELTPILSRGIGAKIDAGELAQAIYEELILASLVNDELARAVEQRRRQSEQRGREQSQASETAQETQ
ncbi:MAG TPA: hypothetical protein VMF55_02025 [Solirubrobacterales bacterium]|nr:hypothetical protein [Solirubrobacterales bacterium]